MAIIEHPARMTVGLAADLAAANRILGAHEIVIESDTDREKRGDGLTRYADLGYRSVETPQPPNLLDYDYTPDGVQNAATATIAAFADLVGDPDVLDGEGGGTILIPEGLNKFFATPVNFTTFGNYISITIKGVGPNSVILPANGAGSWTFQFGTSNIVTFEGLTFVGNPLITDDVLYLAVCGGAKKIIFRRCEFYGISAAHSLLYISTARVVLEDCIFDGCIGAQSVVYGDDTFHSLAVHRSEFMDISRYKNLNYQKNGTPAWIRIMRTDHGTIDPNAPYVYLDDVQFDENGYNCVWLEYIARFEATRLMMNVPSTGGGVVNGSPTGCGVLLREVTSAKISHSAFGYTPIANPAIMAEDNTHVVVDGVYVDVGVILGTVDGTSTIKKPVLETAL